MMEEEDQSRRRSDQQLYPRLGGDAAGSTLNHRVHSGGPGCEIEAFLRTRIRVVLEMVYALRRQNELHRWHAG
jgi:hypothetical protein